MQARLFLTQGNKKKEAETSFFEDRLLLTYASEISLTSM